LNKTKKEKYKNYKTQKAKQNFFFTPQRFLKPGQNVPGFEKNGCGIFTPETRYFFVIEN